jgi:hypothetical protein
MATALHLGRLLDLQRATPEGSDRTPWQHAVDTMSEEGEYTQFTYYHALDEYANMDVATALQSPHVLIRALARLDRRLGRRRFLALGSADLEHPLVRTLTVLRAQAEGWHRSSSGV